MTRALFSLISFFVFTMAHAQSLDLIYKNNSAARAFRAEKKMEAYEQFLSTLAIDPYDPTVQFNVGSVLNSLGEEEKSELLYKQLLKDVDQKLKTGVPQEEQQNWLKVKFAILYNLGVFYQSQQKVDEALDSYQKALELIPQSKEIKTNIEMMLNASGGGKGKGDQKEKQKGDGQGEGESEPKDGEGDKEQDQKDQSNGDRKNEKQGKGFDQTQLSMEDLKRIMEELKQQEQGIRSKVQRKGTKSEPKEKQW
jgi:tetratricopeptide (TPR) repeat protein